jgi:hypothetical protein
MEDSFFSSKSPFKNIEINTIKKSKNYLLNEDNKINENQDSNYNKTESKDEDEKSENSENEMKISVKKEILNSAYTVEDACELIKNVFSAAGEREISVGDGVDIWIVRNNHDVDNHDNNNDVNENNNHNNNNIGDKDTVKNDDYSGDNISQLKNNPFRKSGYFHVEKRFISLSKS